MPTLELIEENSRSCPVSGSSTGVGIPILLLGAVGVIAVVGMVYASGGEKKPGQV